MAVCSEEEYQQIFPQPRLESDHTKQRFAGKVCVVTGGASGIGRATAERFLNDGASVHIIDINDGAMTSMEPTLKSKGLPVAFHKVDVSDKAQCEAAVAQVAEQHGGCIHFLVNSAAIFNYKALTATKEDWDKTLSINVRGYSNMVQSCRPYMIKAGGKGCAVVNISSVSGHIPKKSHWTYCASKSAILMMSKCMALDLSPDGIRVNSVSPGWTWSPQYIIQFRVKREDYEAKFGKYSMFNRFVNMAEVAGAVTFLCSKDAAFITGTDLPVDGGYCAMGPEGQCQETAPMYAEKL